MVTLYIMSGLPFSGKSTLSRKISEQLKLPRISFDEAWLEVEQKEGVVPGVNDVEQWMYINKTCEERALQLLRDGHSVVYDNLGSEYKHREKMRNIANEAEASSKIVYLDVGKKEVNRRREINLSSKERHQVSDENFDKALKTFEPPRENEITIIYNPLQDMEAWIDTEFS